MSYKKVTGNTSIIEQIQKRSSKNYAEFRYSPDKEGFPFCLEK